MKNGEAIVAMFESKFRELIPPLRRSYLIELIEAGLNETYELGKMEALKLLRERCKVNEKH
jgi:hypothetical protein